MSFELKNIKILFLIMFLIFPLCLCASVVNKKDNAEAAKLYEQAKELFERRCYLDASEVLNKSLIKNPYNKDAVAMYRDLIQLFAEEDYYWERNNSTLTKKIEVEYKESQDRFHKILRFEIPLIRFNNKTLIEVIDSIRIATDDCLKDGKGGLNIVLKSKKYSINVDNAVDFYKKNVKDNDFKEESKDDLINMELENIEVGKLIKFVCDATEMSYKFDRDIVLIADESYRYLFPNVTQCYNLEFDLLDYARAHLIEKSEKFKNPTDDIKKYLEDLGVSFRAFSRMKFIKKTNQLIVTNTSKNLRKLDIILTAGSGLGAIDEQRKLQDMEYLLNLQKNFKNTRKLKEPEENIPYKKFIIFFLSGGLIMLLIAKERY